MPRVHFLDTLWVENFNEITLFCMVKANLCFRFWAKIRKLKMAAIFGEGKILHSLDTLWVENFYEIALSRMVKEQICVLPFLAKIRKIKMAAIFGEGKIV